MKKSELLTNEEIARLFPDNFQMAFYAIQNARSRIRAGKETMMADLLNEIKKTLAQFEKKKTENL